MIGARDHGICLLGPDGNMKYLLEEIRHSPLLWLLVLVPVVLSIHALNPEAHTLLFLLSVAAIVPLAALLSRATLHCSLHPCLYFSVTRSVRRRWTCSS